MYDIAGWFGSPPSKHSPDDLVALMLGTARETQIRAGVALASSRAGRIGTSGPVSVLLAGHPCWPTPSLAESAAREGHATLFARLYRERGLSALEQLDGGFLLALHDRDRGAGILAIDRLGICPLAYAETPGGLVFASDLGSLRRHPGIDTAPDPQALFAYLYFHTIPAPLSVYRGVRKLLPGQCLHWRDGNLTSTFYWQPSFGDDPRPEPELAGDLRRTLREAVAACLTDPAATGAFLSGGLDSSTVTGLLSELAPDAAAAFAIGFAAEGYDEMAYARASARRFGVPLHEYYVTPGDVVAAVPEIAACYDEPFGNASAVPAYYCARLARAHGKTWLLAGDGGDELFAGNARYARQKMLAQYERLPAGLRKALIEPLVTRLPLPGKIKSYVTQARLPMPERMETYNFLHRTPPATIFEADFLAAVDPGWPIRHLREVYHRADTPSLLKRMLWLDWKITLADNDLRKVNRMGWLAGVEIRYPMLQRPVVTLAAGIPDRLLMRGFELRSFYRRAFRDFLAPETLQKSKHGFGLPVGVWLKSEPELRELAHASLEHPALSGIIQKSYLADLKQAHQGRHASYYGVMIWILMMWVQWHLHHQE